MKDYIRDNGKIRWCDSNIAKMSVWEYIRLDAKRTAIGQFNTLGKLLADIVEYVPIALLFLGTMLLFPVSFPVIMITKAIIGIKRAKRDCAKYAKPR